MELSFAASFRSRSRQGPNRIEPGEQGQHNWRAGNSLKDRLTPGLFMQRGKWSLGVEEMTCPESSSDLVAENDARIQADYFSQMEKLT